MEKEHNQLAKLQEEPKTAKVLSWVSIFLSGVPVPLAAPVSNVLNKVTTDRKFDRIRAVLEYLIEDFKAHKTDEAERYVRTEEFEELLENTLRRAGNERNEEKRCLYRGFLIGALKAPGGDYDERMRFLKCLEDIQLNELRILRVLMKKASYYLEPHIKSLRNEKLWGIQRPTLLSLLPEMNSVDVDESINRLNSLCITIEIKKGAELILTPFGTKFVNFILLD